MSGFAPWPQYPPCVGGFCTDPICCGLGFKARWPELFGKPAEVAEATIKRDNPQVTVILLPPGRVGSADFCCNRVYLLIDQNGNVIDRNGPQVG